LEKNEALSIRASTRLAAKPPATETTARQRPTIRRRRLAKTASRAVHLPSPVLGRARVSPVKEITAGKKLTDSAKMIRMPRAVNRPKVRKGWMSMATKDSRPAAVVSPAAITTGATAIKV